MSYADGTSGADTTVILQGIIDDAVDGETIDFGGAAYRCDHTIEITGRTGLTLRGLTIVCPHPTGDDSPLAAPSRAARTRTHLRLTDCTDVTLDDVKITGPLERPATTAYPGYRKDLEAQHGVELLGTKATLTGCTIENVWGDALYLGRTVNAWSSATLTGCRLGWTGRHGIGITAAAGVWVNRCDIGNNGRANIDLEPNSVKGGAADIWICHNTIGAAKLLFVAAAHDTQAGPRGPVDRVLVKDNLLTRAMAMMVVGHPESPRTGWQVLDNQSTKKLGAGTETDPAGVLTFVGVDGVEVKGNTQPCQPKRWIYGVKATSCTGVDVADNSFPDARGELLER